MKKSIIYKANETIKNNIRYLRIKEDKIKLLHSLFVHTTVLSTFNQGNQDVFSGIQALYIFACQELNIEPLTSSEWKESVINFRNEISDKKHPLRKLEIFKDYLKERNE